MELERHPPERGTLPVVVAGGCCTTCCCCCCCCAYVVGGLAGAAVGTLVASRQEPAAKEASARYWAIVRVPIILALVLGAAGFVIHWLWLLAAGMALLGVPLAQALGSLLMFINRDPAARRAALKITLAWVAFTIVGWWITLGIMGLR